MNKEQHSWWYRWVDSQKYFSDDHDRVRALKKVIVGYLLVWTTFAIFITYYEPLLGVLLVGILLGQQMIKLKNDLRRARKKGDYDE